ncbi:cellulase family glycosylhydrolase [Ruegeria arenilitoris]|uniref:cellulase family glycosylhydrolase n=1 Tax=Ruegeria arenilitoris TaxID=1173585 RepID=UPI003464BF4C
MRNIHSILFTICLCLFTLHSDRDVAEASEDWPLDKITLRTATPDLSGLNHKPAGIHGRVMAQGDQLIFEDGTPIRFWGANLQAYAIYFTEPRNIKAHAKRLAQLGFNLVRIHHHDSDWVQPNIFGENAKTTTQLNPAWLNKLDQWITALKDEGIYIWLDLHVGRRFTASDGVENFEELAGGQDKADAVGFNFVSPSIERLMQEFQTAFLSHKNKYTGLSYSEEPAVIAVQITNENDLTHHFGNILLPDKGVPRHSETYMALANAFAKEHGFDAERTWRAWEFGPSKIFLNDLEHKFFDRMAQSVRDTGFDGLISTTSLWGEMSIAGLPSQMRGGIVDTHSYGWEGEIDFDPRQRAGLLDWLAIAQVDGLPLSVSEWNIGTTLAEDRFVAPVRVAAMAAFQGWDAMMVYGYSQQGLNGNVFPENWSIASDPGMIWMMPAAAILYRAGHIRQAEQTYALCPDASDFFGRSIAPDTSIGIRTIIEQSRLVTCMPETPALPWLTATNLTGKSYQDLDPDRSYLKSRSGVVEADTGEFFRAFEKGQFVVNIDNSQIVAGRFHGEPVKTSNVEFNVDNPMAAIAVQSLDQSALTQARRILISISGRAISVHPEDENFRIEPITGILRIQARPDLELISRDGRVGDVSAAHTVKDGVHEIDLGKVKGSRWLYLE